MGRTLYVVVMLEVLSSDGICLLRLNAPPLNAITLEMLDALCAAVEQGERDSGIRAFVLTGGRETFSAGADIRLFEGLKTAEDALQLSQRFQEAYQRLEDASKPLVVALAGQVLGGALELALACHGRVAATGTRLGLPEIRLGILPGAGGTQRLSRLVGPATALRMMLTGDPLDANAAQQAGLVDAVCPPDQLEQQARRLVLNMPEPVRTRLRTDRIADAEELATAVHRANELLAGSRPEIIAPRQILEVVQLGIRETFAAGLDAERTAFARCMETPAAGNKIHIFFATRQVTKFPEFAAAVARPIRRVAVVGMGTMGTGIAHAVLQSGLEAVVLDEQPAAAERGRQRIAHSLERRVQDGKLTSQQLDQTLARLRVADDWQELAEAELLIETVFEDSGVKCQVLERLERLCADTAILASNTSTISLDVLASRLRTPERLVGVHFFNPAQRMPLVEVIRHDRSSPDALATALQFAKSLRKTPVLVANREGFLVNRLFVPYLQEAFQLLEEGCEPSAVDQAAVEFGFPMGPFVLIDMAGLDILVHAQHTLRHAFPRHGDLSRIATQLVELGHLGQKTGRGVYRYEAGSHTPHDSPTTADVIAAVRADGHQSISGTSREAITERLVLRMVNEAHYVLAEKVARSARDIDVATVLGIGFPDFRGGLCRYAEQLGRQHVRERLAQLAQEHGERFAGCDSL